MLHRLLIVAVLVLAPSLGRAQTPPAACAYDRAALLAMDVDRFDQAPTGWRSVGQKPGCERAAIELIRAYRQANAVALVNGPLSALKILDWHEAQLLANAGDTDAAVRMFVQARPGSAGDSWDFYAEAVVAFLQGRRADLLATRAAMAALPEPAWFSGMRFQDPRLKPSWPQNLNVVDRLVACFGMPYAELEGPQCEAAVRRGPSN